MYVELKRRRSSKSEIDKLLQPWGQESMRFGKVSPDWAIISLDAKLALTYWSYINDMAIKEVR